MASGEDYLDSLLDALDGKVVQEEEKDDRTSGEMAGMTDDSASGGSYDGEGEDMDFPELAKLFEEETAGEPEETADVPAASFDAEITEEGPELQEAHNMDISDLEALMTPDLPDDTSGKADQETDLLENADVTDLIDALDDDDDLAEIGELLKKSDNNETIDDDLPSDKKNIGEKGEQTGSADRSGAASADTASGKKMKKEKKKKDPSQKGLLHKIISFFTDEDEDEEDEVIGEERDQIDLSQENVAILEELDKEKAKPGKKPKKEKQPKPKKEKKPKAKKEKKPKPKKVNKPKPKKEKKPKAPKEPEKPLKPIGAKRIVITLLFALTVFGMIMLFTMYIPNYMDRQNGRKAYQEGDYRTAYELFVTKSVKGQDETILKGSKLCLEIDRKLESYENYRKMEGMEVEQLHALIGGVDKFWKIEAEAQQYGVSGYVNNRYLDILSILQAQYGVSEEEARSLTEITDSVAYTKELKRILGLDIPAVSEEEVSEE